MSPRPRKSKTDPAQHALCAPAITRSPEHLTTTNQGEEACLVGPNIVEGKQFGGICLTVPHVAGIDEAGRGCLAGPVVAAAVILPEGFILSGLNDSKQLSVKQRDLLAPQIKSSALAWSVGLSWPREIERCNILQATFHAMSRAVRSLRLAPQHLLIDGNKTIPLPVLQRYCRALLPSQQAIIGGDALEAAISAASILAKTYRDHLMQVFHTRHPAYGFDRHKGYGTKEHLARLQEHGPCPQHRTTFAGVLPPGAAVQHKSPAPVQGSLC